MAERRGATERLDSWKDIATYLGRNVRTAMRWEQGKGLPVHRVPGGHRQAVYAWTHEIDKWLRKGIVSQSESAEVHEYSDHVDAGETAAEPTNMSSPPRAASEPEITLASRLRFGSSPRRLVWVAAALILFFVGAVTLRSLAFPPPIQFTGVTQLTSDGFPKEGLVTDGRSLYFGEHRNGGVVLAATSVAGGPLRIIPTPFLKSTPLDISSDRKELLVAVREGEEEERALWIVPIAGGPPRPVGNVHCQAAALSPNGREIAFAAGNTIYLTADEGKSVHPIENFATVPHLLRWSPDGKRLRFDLRDPKSFDSSFWEITLDGNPEVKSIMPLHLTFTNAGSMTFDGSGHSFISIGDSSGGRIVSIMRTGPFGFSHIVQEPLNREITGPADLTLDIGSARIFALGQSGVANEISSPNQKELIWFDIHSLAYRPMLPGVSAQDIDFSPDKNRIAYVSEPEHGLWMSNVDGTNAKRIPTATVDLELPKWSPDGKSIAFMGRVDDGPWRIYVVNPNNGEAREASVGNDNQGAPTWSPDGKWLAYGNVRCQQTNTCAIHQIRLSNGEESIVPGSEGLATARWSPNGQFIAALAPDRQEVMVFNVASQEWRKLSDGINGTDLSWSADSKYVYASKPLGRQPEIVRVPMNGGPTEEVVNLTSLSKLSGRIETWFTLAPDGSIILAHGVNSNEIYALNVGKR